MYNNFIKALFSKEKYGIFVIKDTKFIYINETFSKIFGYQRDELLNLHPSNIILSNEINGLFNRKIYNNENTLDPNKTIVGRRKDKSVLEFNLEAFELIEYNNSITLCGVIKTNNSDNLNITLCADNDIMLIKSSSGNVLVKNDLTNRLFATKEDALNIEYWYEIDELVHHLGIIKYMKVFKELGGVNRNYQIIKIPLITNDNILLVLGFEVNDLSAINHNYNFDFIEFEDLFLSVDSITAITVLDKNFSYIYVNDPFCKVINYSPKELIGRTFKDINSGYNDKTYFDGIFKIVRKGNIWRGVIKSYRENNILVEANVTIIPITNFEGTPYKYITIRNNISMKKQIEIANKQSIEEYIDEQTRANNGNMLLAFYVLEINEINLLEKIYGSEALQIYIEFLQNNLKKAKVFLLSINTIGVILNEIENMEQLNQIAKGLSGLSKINLESNVELVISSIVGVGFSGSTKENTKEIIENAYFALESAKVKKKKYEIYQLELAEKSLKKYSLKQDLYSALDNDELELYYQPKFNNYKKVIGAEALIRWNHPKYGLITPIDFISIAEETELIISIGEWVIESACRQGEKWVNLGYKPVNISINVSPIQLMQSDFVSKFEEIVRKSEYTPNLLEIEITEDVIRDNDYIINVIKNIKNLGISISIDDFGIGYSSYELLKDYNVDTIKIDRSFISNIAHNTRSKEITASIINLANQLKLNIVAEGVETDEQFNILKNMDCPEYQGYLISKPVPADLFEKFINYKDFFVEKRRFFRVNFPYPLEANLEILELNKKQVNLGKTFVLIENMSAGGLCFLSNIKFPADDSLIISFDTKILSENLYLQGRIVWSNENIGFIKYGLQFKADSYKQDLLIRLLNKAQISLKRSGILEGSRIVQISESEKKLYFQQII